MSIGIQFFTVVSRRETVERKYPGGLVQYQSAPFVWCDEYIVGSSFMNYLDVDDHIEHLRKQGFLVDPSVPDSEVAIVDQSRGVLTKAAWLEFAIQEQRGAICWLKGQLPGEAVYPGGNGCSDHSPAAIFLPKSTKVLQLTGGKQIVVKQGDITEELADAIVNPANSRLIHGGGAAKAIALRGGEQVRLESQAIIRQCGFIPVGQAVITGAGQLPCRFVIHVVGPRAGAGAAALLEQGVHKALSLAEEHGLKSIAMPAISSGIFGFPKPECAQILLKAAHHFLSQPPVRLQTVIMCNHDAETVQIFGQYLDDSSLFQHT